MSGSGAVAEARGGSLSDMELVASVRAGDDVAFEELYRRYHHRIRAFLHKRLRDAGRAEDVTQEAFLSALRRMRATDADIAFKPWLFEIARNAAIDVHRRQSRTEEVPVREDMLVAQAPDTEVFARERLELLSGAFEELPETHHRALVMREFEGRSYREIGERLKLSNSAVESTLFRARRRLEHEYGELDSGRRCESARATAALLAEGLSPGLRGRRRFVRHTRRCLACRRHAIELGVTPSSRLAELRDRAAALLPLPLFLRRRAAEAADAAGSSLTGPGGHVGAGLMERTASLLAAAALAGAGGAAMTGVGGMEPPAKIGAGQVPTASPAAVQPAKPTAGSAGHGLPPSATGKVVAPGERGTEARSKRGHRDRFAPDRAGQREAAKPVPEAIPPAASPAPAADERLPGRPHALGVPDTGALARDAVSQTTTGGLKVVRDASERTGALLGTVNRQSAAVTGETGKGLLNLVDR